MTYHQLASEISSLIAGERFDDALHLLPAYAQAVTEACPSEDDFRQARDFLKAACKSVKARRAHYISQLGTAKGQRAYMGSGLPIRSVDVTG